MTPWHIAGLALVVAQAVALGFRWRPAVLLVDAVCAVVLALAMVPFLMAGGVLGFVYRAFRRGWRSTR